MSRKNGVSSQWMALHFGNYLTDSPRAEEI